MSIMSQERVWFVTGCSSGIGRVIAEGVLQAGERVVVTARRTEQIQDIADRFPGRALVMPLDVTRTESIASAIAGALDHFRRIDVLINNAAIGLVAALEESTLDEVENMFRTNVLGVLDVIRQVAPHMRARRQGRIITMGSIGSFRGRGGLGIYAATKHALAGLHDALADEMQPLGIHPTLLLLGSYRTGFRHRGMHQGERVIEAYDATSGAVRRTLQQPYPENMGDPATIPPALIALANASSPPRQLLLGADAVAAWRAKQALMTRDVELWEGFSTRADQAPPADQSEG